MESSNIERKASHAGSWYNGNKRELSNQLDKWLKDAGSSTHGPARAIISPHAGYQYCGSCAAYAYKEICPTTTRRIFILGPSHHIHLSGCALSPASIYKTPLYDLTIDRTIYEQLYATNEFEQLSLYADEDEHSIEMQLSFIAKIMESRGSAAFTIVPILVGSLNVEKEAKYGRILAPYLADPANVFVISSDFCHWGARFNYQYYEQSWGDIHESIEKLDHLGMEKIESLEPTAFTSYLKTYRNTICGRHPIAVLLNAIKQLRINAKGGGSLTNGNAANHHNHQNGNSTAIGNGNYMNGDDDTGNNEAMINGDEIGSSSSQDSSGFSLRFLNYAQSSRCLRMRDSSVSYASASFVINNN